jgi:hypothetical protein
MTLSHKIILAILAIAAALAMFASIALEARPISAPSPSKASSAGQHPMMRLPARPVSVKPQAM